jgi:phosphatidate cytidylyltransferase
MLAARVATALVLVLGFLCALFYLPPVGWAAFTAGLVAIAGWEWGGLSGFSDRGRIAYAFATGVAAWASSAVAQSDGDIGLVVHLPALVFWLCIAPIWLGRKWRLEGKSASGAVGWLVLLSPAVALVQLRGVAPVLLLACMAVVWVADIAAYFTGRAWGRRKLAPSISPGKTWEGAAGAAAAVLAYGLAVGVAFNRGVIPPGIVLLAGGVSLVVLTAVSIVGDLFESLVKRQAGVKDSSRLLPGHGGVLDRIDSLTSTLPFVAVGAHLILR